MTETRSYATSVARGEERRGAQVDRISSGRTIQRREKILWFRKERREESYQFTRLN